jgi:glycosyltransferase involved in cell wall biosynthesis
MTPTFSIVMPSFLGAYKGAAKDRDKKIVRAIESVRSQTYDSWELIIVADGCSKTFDMVSSLYRDDNRIGCYLIEKQPLWSGVPRNVGQKYAKGVWTTYLDIDDQFGNDHLTKLALGIDMATSAGQKFDWVFYNDHIAIAERPCKPVQGRCGTSNVTFRRSLNVQWKDATYLHDWRFIQELLKHPYVTIPTPEYHVMHVPRRVDL